MEQAEKILKAFLKELKKNGFTKAIKKHLNLVWQEKDIFENTLKKLKGVKFDYKNIKFISKDERQKMYRFTADINDKETNLFVQPLKEIGVPYDYGYMGVIPVKLLKFGNIQTVEEIKDNLANILISKEEKERQEIYIQFLKDGGNAKDFEDWLKDLNKSGIDSAKAADKLKKDLDISE